MTTVKIDYRKVYILISGTWVDISDDVLFSQRMRLNYGIAGNSVTDRCASSGGFYFVLDNSAANSAGLIGYYTPGHTNCRTGFDVGAEVRLEYGYDNRVKTKWRGRIIGINIDQGTTGTRRVSVTCQDLIGDYSQHDITSPIVQTNKTVDEVLPTLTALAPREPCATEYDTGNSTFPTVFDLVRSNTRILTELNRLAISELGYIYTRYDYGNYGETLVFENRQRRSGISTDTTVVDGNPGYILNEAGGYLLDEAGNRILQNALTTAAIDNELAGADISRGKQLANRVLLTCYPRTSSAAPVTLWKNSQTFSIAPGETAVFEGQFTDPDTLQPCSAVNVIQPIGTTDYSFYKSGPVDITADVTVTSFTAGANDFKIYLHNANASRAYSTPPFKVRGTSVNTSDKFQYTAEDSTSAGIYGRKTLSIELKYQDDVTLVSAFGDVILSKLKDPITQADSITLFANHSSQAMQLFMDLEVGDRLTLTEDVSGINESYFIQSISWTDDGQAIQATYGLKQAISDMAYYQFYDVPTADTFISASAPNVNWGDFDQLIVSERVANQQRGLLKFNLPSASAVISASLNIYLTYVNQNNTILIYRSKRAWTELGATWNKYDGSNDWATAGGMGAADYDNTLVGSIPIEAGFSGYKTITLEPALITDMCNGTMTNNGFLLVSELATVNEIGILSRETSNPPELTMSYLV